MTKETAQRIANNFFTRYEGSKNPEEIYSTEINNRLRDQILDAFNTSHPTTLPSDLVAEITKLQEQWDENGVGLPYHIQLSRVNSCIDSLFKDQLAKIAEMERDKPSLQDRLFSLANDFAVAKQGDIAVRLHSIHNSITTTP